MVEQKEIFGMLDLMTQPGFCVKDNTIQKVNQAAQALMISPGTEPGALLLTDPREYADFRGGCLHLTLSLSGRPWGASVIRMDQWDIFLLDDAREGEELRTLALAARELRKPMDSLMTLADQLSAQTDPALCDSIARLNRGLYQMLRVLGNMSDAGQDPLSSRQETVDISRVFREVFEKAQTLAISTGITLTYEDLTESVYCLANAPQLERAVLNILSNALKFTPKGGSIRACLQRSGRMLRLTVQDSGSGIAENILSSLFRRHQRQPAIEDPRYGIGLGMILVRNAAASHGGTVLIDQPEGAGTRITLTLAIRQSSDTGLHSPVLQLDYAGERDHGLLELSDVLPAELYRPDL